MEDSKNNVIKLDAGGWENLKVILFIMLVSVSMSSLFAYDLFQTETVFDKVALSLLTLFMAALFSTILYLFFKKWISGFELSPQQKYLKLIWNFMPDKVIFLMKSRK